MRRNNAVYILLNYITGVDDETECFYCGGTIYEWEPSDDPWVEHAENFPKCGFLKILNMDKPAKKQKALREVTYSVSATVKMFAQMQAVVNKKN